MNISYNWLKDLINVDFSPEGVANELTRIGLAVEGVHPQADDFVLDIDLTSNRPDCLSHLGVARELYVVTGKEFPAKTQSRKEETDVPFPAVLAPDVVKVEDPDLCYRFTARIIRNVKIGPSPDWLVKRLEAVGERSINNVADITNYVMLELGQPMHAFDLDKLAGKRIVVRRAMAGETITTLDQVERKLDETVLAICDVEKPVAIGGVMGGLDSSITGTTSNVLLEVAYFDRASIRHTARKLNLATEASNRFERGVDIENLKLASDRAAELIVQLAGGQAGEFIDIYPTHRESVEIPSRDISRAVERLTGLDVRTEDCIRILNNLGIAAKDGSKSHESGYVFISPSWRYDIAIEEDLVEEVARHAGYENIADELPPAYGAGEYQPNEVKERLLRQTLIDMGFDEAISYSFIDTSFDQRFELVPGIVDKRANDKFITLRDSVIEGAVRMRPTLLPGLLNAVRLNFNYQRRDVKLFEIGKAFAASAGEDDLPTERELFAVVIIGGEIQENRAVPARELDFFDAKGAVEAALEALGFVEAEFRAEDFNHLRKGQSASVSIGGKAVGSVGRLNEEISAFYKLKQPVFLAEIDLEAVLSRKAEPITYRPLPRYPSVIRDVSFLVKRDMSYAEIRRAIEEQRVELCRSVEFVDVFEGKGIAEDARSLTLRLEYRSDERTLIDADADAVHNQILNSLETSLGIRRRF